jgi:hypothetical protein
MGAGTGTLTLSSATTNDAGSYEVIISSVWGSVTSEVATLTVGLAPAITQQPTNQMVFAGGVANFSVGVIGSQPLSYQWAFNGTNVSGATNATLAISNVQPSQVGSYAVSITNLFGSVQSSNATLVAVAAPTIILQPSNVTVSAGSTAIFSVNAGGTAPLRYQWKFNGTNIYGATNASLTLYHVLLSQSGNYAVRVTNSFGSIRSSNALLSVTVDHFTWGTIPALRFVNTPFSVTVQAWGVGNGNLTNFAGSAFLDSTTGVAVSPAVSGNFVGGTWTGMVTISQTATNLVLRASDGLGHVGLADPINVVSPPALNLQVSRNSLLLFWPAGYPGFVVETSGNLATGDWQSMSNAPIHFGNQFLLPLQMSATNGYYRLRFSGP